MRCSLKRVVTLIDRPRRLLRRNKRLSIDSEGERKVFVLPLAPFAAY